MVVELFSERQPAVSSTTALVRAQCHVCERRVYIHTHIVVVGGMASSDWLGEDCGSGFDWLL